jgi:thiol-disulfide isomerase/thioredoxin
MNLMKLSIAAMTVATVTAAVAAGPESYKGKPIPTFSMKRVDGGTLNSKALKGKVVVLDFWASWCGPCKAASPTMQSLYQKYAKQGLVVIGANITDPVAKAAAYPKEHKYTYPFTSGNDAYANKLGIQNIPVFMFIDRKGIVQKVDTGFGPNSAADWEKAIKQLLAKK